MIFPTFYFISDVFPKNGIGQVLTNQSILAYWMVPEHTYILVSSIIFGLFLGVVEISNYNTVNMLRHISKRLQELVSWSFDEELIEAMVNNTLSLEGQRVHKIIFFMDIRGFTKWSEEQTLPEAIEMLNSYYEVAENSIVQAGGHKARFVGDEVMTWFDANDTLF